MNNFSTLEHICHGCLDAFPAARHWLTMIISCSHAVLWWMQLAPANAILTRAFMWLECLHMSQTKSLLRRADCKLKQSQYEFCVMLGFPSRWNLAVRRSTLQWVAIATNIICPMSWPEEQLQPRYSHMRHDSALFATLNHTTPRCGTESTRC